MSGCKVEGPSSEKFEFLKTNMAKFEAIGWSNLNIKKSGDKELTGAIKLQSFINLSATPTNADGFLKTLIGYKLLYPVKSGRNTWYRTQYPALITEIFENKQEIFAINKNGNIDWDSETYEPSYLYLSKRKINTNSTVFAANFDNSVEKDISRIGEGMLGTSLMSLDGVVKTELVNQTVDTIVEKIAREVIAGNDLTRADIDSVIDGYYDAFVDYYEKAEASDNQKAIEHIESYLDENNWENLRNMIYTALKNRSGIIFSNGVKSKDVNDSKIQDEDAIKDNNEDIDVEGGDKAQGNYADNFAITLDNKVGLSGKLKLFMSTLKNDKKHYLTGEPLFENFDTAYNTLNAILAGEEPNIYGMIAKLKEYKDYGWINDLINKLEEANHKDSGNQDLVKQFVTAMNKHYINMSFIQWENTPTGHELRIMNDNANSRQRTVTNDWVTALNKTNLVYTNTEFKKLLDKDAAKLALEKLNALGNKELFDLKPNDITEFFKLIGINLSPRSAKAIIDGKFELRGKKIPVEDFFNVKKSTSPLKHIGDILKRVIASQEPIEVGSKDVDFFRQGTVKALADLEAKHTRHLYSNSHRSGSKTVFSYTNDKFIVDRLYELVRGFKTGNKDNYKLLEELSTDVFAGNSYWLSELKQAMEDGDTTFIENFDFGYISLDPLKKKNDEASDRSMADRAAKEILAIKLAHFLNKGERIGKDKRRVINMLYPTTSDKTIGITIQSLIPQIDGGIKYGFTKEYLKALNTLNQLKQSQIDELESRTDLTQAERNAEIDKLKLSHRAKDITLNLNFPQKTSINDGAVDFIYEKIVKSEMNRMWAVQKQTQNYSLSTDIDGYDDGAKYFYTIPALNGIKGLFDFDTVPGKRLLKPENEIEPDVEALVRSTIKRSLNLMIATQIDEFKANDIGYVKGEDNLQYMDTDGVADLAADYGNINLKEKSDAVAASFAINYFIHNANVAQLFHGDYAQYFKNNDIAEDFEKMIENDNVTNMALLHAMIKPTFDNLGKRLAADVAPGYEADWGDKTQLFVTVSNDRKMKSLAMKYIELIYQKNVEGLSPHDAAEKKAALKAYNKINSSDAQSYSSLEFHIKTLFNFGNKNITEKEYNHLIDKINKAKAKGEDVHFEADELALVLQPTKPIYSNNSQQRNNDGSTIGVRKYIKTSTFPLIPQLVKGSELEAVMRAMDKGNVDMHVYESGFKVGMNSTHVNEDKGEAQSGKLSLFNKDGSMNFEEVDKLSLSKNIMSLDIKGFKIQQEVPYHDHPGDVNKGTQESKLLFSNIRKILGFNYKGEKYSGAQLEEMYSKAYKKLYADAARSLRKELYIDGKLNIEKIQQLFLEEANSRNYSINDKLGLALNEKKDAFEFPLWALPAAHQYESMLISIVDNRVRKLKIPGNSFVLGSEAGFNFKNQVKSGKEGKAIVSKYQDQIIFTSNFNGESLLPYRPDGEFMRPTQVFVPMKLKGSNGEFINLMKYTKRIDGKLMLDEERVPKDLLKLFGFRIPTQGHNSMAAIEIAGFLPKECGDLIIASQDLVIQMGSDKR